MQINLVFVEAGGRKTQDPISKIQALDSNDQSIKLTNRNLSVSAGSPAAEIFTWQGILQGPCWYLSAAFNSVVGIAHALFHPSYQQRREKNPKSNVQNPGFKSKYHDKRLKF